MNELDFFTDGCVYDEFHSIYLTFRDVAAEWTAEVQECFLGCCSGLKYEKTIRYCSHHAKYPGVPFGACLL